MPTSSERVDFYADITFVLTLLVCRYFHMVDLPMELHAGPAQWNSELRDEASMMRQPMERLVLCIAAVVLTQSALAQEPPCRLYKVQSSSLNVSKEPRGDAAYIDMLDNGDIVCVTREQKVGERNWGFVDHKLLKPDQRKPVAGWANLGLLQRLPDAQGAAGRGATAPPPAAAAAAPAEEVVRFNEPLTTGPYPVNGQSLEQLLEGIPLFPPMEGLDEAAWKKQCNACHKWDRRTLCEQGATYVKNPRSALRGSHPYGGAEKVAIMQWAKTGCQ